MDGSNSKDGVWTRVLRAAKHQKAKWLGVAALSAGQAASSGLLPVGLHLILEGRVGVAVAVMLAAGSGNSALDAVNTFVSRNAAEKMHDELTDDNIAALAAADPAEITISDAKRHASQNDNPLEATRLLATIPRLTLKGIFTSVVGTAVTLQLSGAPLSTSWPLILAATGLTTAGVVTGTLQIPMQLGRARNAQSEREKLATETHQWNEKERAYLRVFGHAESVDGYKQARDAAMNADRRSYFGGFFAAKRVEPFHIIGAVVPIALNEALHLHLPNPTLYTACVFYVMLGEAAKNLDQIIRTVPTLQAHIENMDLVRKASKEAQERTALEREALLARERDDLQNESLARREPARTRPLVQLPIGHPPVDVLTFERVEMPIDRYGSNNPATLRLDFDLRLHPDVHRQVVVNGPSGSGKTTGFVDLPLLERKPQKGRLLFNGRDVRLLPADEYLSLFGYVPQDTRLPYMTVGDAMRAAAPGKPERVLGGILYDLHIRRPRPREKYEPPFDIPIGTLSGGERSRLYVAIAVLKDPRILLLDEPFSGLDQHEAVVVDKIIREVKATTIHASHYQHTRRPPDELIVLGPDRRGDFAVVDHRPPWSSGRVKWNPKRGDEPPGREFYMAQSPTDPAPLKEEVLHPVVDALDRAGLMVNIIEAPPSLGEHEIRSQLLPAYHPRQGRGRRVFTLSEASTLLGAARGQGEIASVRLAMDDLETFVERLNGFGPDYPRFALLIEPTDRSTSVVQALLGPESRQMTLSIEGEQSIL